MKAHQYNRRILLAVTGLSPQIVTETVYALAVKPPRDEDPFVPTEIHLLTTRQGADNARLNLLSGKPGWFHQLCKDYCLPKIAFDETHIHVLCDATGQPLDDIRSIEDNERAADFITETVRELTRDDNAAVHVSIAGGRKTMGFYLGYALSLFGRMQDRLSHVLISSPFESHPQFYYPTPYEHVFQTHEPKPRPLDARNAKVTLADIPFVRLRQGLDERLLGGVARYSQTVAAAQHALGSMELVIDLATRRIRAGGVVMRLAPADLAFMSWFARRRAEKAPALACPAEGAPEQNYATEYLSHYRAVIGAMGDDDRTVERYRGGMSKHDFLERKSKLLRALKEALGPAGSAYAIQGRGRPAGYSVQIDADAIRFESITDNETTGTEATAHE